MKKSWNTLHSLLGSKNNKKSTDKILGHVISDSDKNDIVNKFNDFFTSIGNNLAAQMPDSVTSPVFPSDYMQHNFFLLRVTKF